MDYLKNQQLTASPVKIEPRELKSGLIHVEVDPEFIKGTRVCPYCKREVDFYKNSKNPQRSLKQHINSCEKKHAAVKVL